MFADLADLVFPPRCLICDSYAGPFVEPTLCRPCLESLLDVRETVLPSMSVAPLHAWAAGTYDGKLRKLITAAKFERDPLPVQTLNLLLFRAYVAASPPLGVVITSIPAHPARTRKRGIDLPGYLGRRLASRVGTCYERLLHRTREVPAQQSLSRRERLRNLEGLFVAARDLAGTAVVVVDDIFTTGATAEAASTALFKDGCPNVIFLALARTPLELDGSVSLS